MADAGFSYFRIHISNVYLDVLEDMKKSKKEASIADLGMRLQFQSHWGHKYRSFCSEICKHKPGVCMGRQTRITWTPKWRQSLEFDYRTRFTQALNERNLSWVITRKRRLNFDVVIGIASIDMESLATGSADVYMQLCSDHSSKQLIQNCFLHFTCKMTQYYPLSTFTWTTMKLLVPDVWTRQRLLHADTRCKLHLSVYHSDVNTYVKKEFLAPKLIWQPGVEMAFSSRFSDLQEQVSIQTSVSWQILDMSTVDLRHSMVYVILENPTLEFTYLHTKTLWSCLKHGLETHSNAAPGSNPAVQSQRLISSYPAHEISFTLNSTLPLLQIQPPIQPYEQSLQASAWQYNSNGRLRLESAMYYEHARTPVFEIEKVSFLPHVCDAEMKIGCRGGYVGPSVSHSVPNGSVKHDIAKDPQVNLNPLNHERMHDLFHRHAQLSALWSEHIQRLHLSKHYTTSAKQVPILIELEQID